MDTATPLKPKRQGHDMSPLQRVNAELNWDIKIVRGAARNLASLCRKYHLVFEKILLKQVPGEDVCRQIEKDIEKRIATRRKQEKQKSEELKQSPPIDKAPKP